MHQEAIFYPIMAMMLLSHVVTVILYQRRVNAVREGLNPAYFRFNRGVKLPDELMTAEQHYQNIHEMPVLFYVTSILIYLSAAVTNMTVLLAWCYVGARLAHALIHIGTNKLLWRRNAFSLSFLILVLMWIGMVVKMGQ